MNRLAAFVVALSVVGALAGCASDNSTIERDAALRAAIRNISMGFTPEKDPLPLTSVRFKPGVKVYRFAASLFVSDTFELRDGTTYVVANIPNHRPATSVFDYTPHLGMLDNGVITYLPLPGHPKGMGFSGSLSGQPVVETSPPIRRYVLEGVHAIAISPSRALGYDGTDAKLHDGTRCVVQKGSAYVDRGGTRQLLVARTAIGSALDTPEYSPQHIRCATFDGDDYLEVDDSFILKILGNNLELVADGEIRSSGPRHILFQPLTPPSKLPSYYLEAIAP